MLPLTPQKIKGEMSPTLVTKMIMRQALPTGEVLKVTITKVRYRKRFERIRRHRIFRKYSEDEPRDSQGKWSSGGDGGNDYRAILDRQRRSEGMRVAVINNRTGKVTIGKPGEIHHEVVTRAHEADKGDYSSKATEWEDTHGNFLNQDGETTPYTAGFVNSRGTFHSREEQDNWAARMVGKYSDDQPRDENGQWTSGGGSGGGGSTRVVFEVAPNPADPAAMARWNKLTPEEKLQRSKDVAEKYVPQILAEQNIEGDVKTQIGSYQDDTNASFSLELPPGTDPESIIEATKALGYNLSQQSMMTVSDAPFPGSSPVDSIQIVATEEFTLNSAQDLYNGLRGIESDGTKAVGGATTVGNTMMVLNYDKTMSTADLAKAVETHLSGSAKNYEIHVKTLNSWFATEADYAGYQNNSSQAGGNLSGGHNSGNANNLRDTISQAVTKAFVWILKKYPNSFPQEVIRKYSDDQPRDSRGMWTSGGDSGSGDEASRYSTMTRTQLAPTRATLMDSRAKLSPTGPYKDLAAQEFYNNTPGKDVTKEQVAQVMAMANEELRNTIAPALDELQLKLGAAGIPVDVQARAKNVESAYNKMTTKESWEGRPLANLTDSVGTRVIFDTPEDMIKAVPMLEQALGMKCIEQEDFMDKGKNGGYRAQHLLFETKNGVVFEMQLQTQLQHTFVGYSHSIYKMNHGFTGITGSRAQDARNYATAVGNWIHAFDSGRHTGRRPATPGWMKSKNLGFPWARVPRIKR